MQSREIDKELKELMEESERLTFNEYCKTCFQDRRWCDGCRADGDANEPEMYMSSADMMLQCELEACND